MNFLYFFYETARCRFWNLSGNPKQSIDNHHLQLNSKFYTVVDKELIVNKTRKRNFVYFVSLFV